MSLPRILLHTLCLGLLLVSMQGRANDSPRVVALSWEMVEHLLKLNITPIAVADAKDYRTWVVHPRLLDSVPNAGTRTEPNLELLVQLKPDLILITPLLEDIRPLLERIAPVVSYDDFTQTQDNRLLQRENFRDLAKRLDRESLANTQLKAMDDHFADMRQRLHQHFGAELPKVSMVLFSSTAVVNIMGPNSMPEHAMQLLGLASAHQVPISRWGNVQVSITELGAIDEGVVLYLPFAQKHRLFKTQLWQSMPFVRKDHVVEIRSTWTHGGIFCIENLAEAFTDALLTLSVN